MDPNSVSEFAIKVVIAVGTLMSGWAAVKRLRYDTATLSQNSTDQRTSFWATPTGRLLLINFVLVMNGVLGLGCVGLFNPPLTSQTVAVCAMFLASWISGAVGMNRRPFSAG